MGGAMIPERVPSRVRIPRRVHGDFPFHSTFVEPGEYPCESNRYGAVSVLATNGKPLGLRPGEFEALEWIQNPALDQVAAAADPEAFQREYLGGW